MKAVSVWKETYTNSDPLTISFNDFNSLEARLMRYRVNWAMFENTAYRKVNSWARSYLAAYGLYKFIRPVYNPASKLGDWWQSHIWGGLLDPAAGDGRAVPSAIPILTEDENLRKAISQLWLWSNWQENKGIVSLHGPVLGDTVIKIEDDPIKERVYMRPIHPGTLADVTLDSWGNVKEYTIEEPRKDPKTGTEVRYKELCQRKENDSNVYYSTYKNDSLFSWNDDGKPEWSVEYGFVPMVLIRHRSIGLPWGWSEMHTGLPIFREVDDQASLLNDQIRKTVNAGWFFSGVTKPTSDPKTGKTTESAAAAGDPEGDRQATPALYGPPGSSASPMVAPLQIEAVLSGIDKMLKKIERDYPELSDDLDNSSGDISGRALRINRQPVITKVKERRPNYDNGLVRAQQMAIAIGGMRGYEGFQGFDLDSYASGKLNHTIAADRPVYDKDPLDDLEVETELWTAAKAAKDAGIPLMVFLRRQGWTDEQITKLQNDPEYMMRQEQQQASLDAQKALGNQPTPPGVNPKVPVKPVENKIPEKK